MEAAAVVTVAVVVLLWNILVGGYTDFDGVQHAAVLDNFSKVGLPLSAFSLTNPSLGLLLGRFRIVIVHLHMHLYVHVLMLTPQSIHQSISIHKVFRTGE